MELIVHSENDFITSVEKSLKEIDPYWQDYQGVLVVGSHSPTNIDEKIDLLRGAREANIPALGICMGMQLMAVEYARNKLGLLEAQTEEVNPHTPVNIITKMPELRVGVKEVTWNGKKTQESHWHNFKFNTDYTRFFKDDWEMSETDGIIEVMKLKDHLFYTGVQFHPEYNSTIGKPHWVLREFINACKLTVE